MKILIGRNFKGIIKIVFFSGSVLILTVLLNTTNNGGQICFSRSLNVNCRRIRIPQGPNKFLTGYPDVDEALKLILPGLGCYLK
jgi:hypothetical protein